MTNAASPPFAALDFQALFDMTPHPYLILTSDLKVVYANAAYLLWLNMPLEDLVGKDIAELFAKTHRDWFASLEQSMRRAIQTHSSDNTILPEYPISSSDLLSQTRYQYKHVPLITNNGEIQYLIHTFEPVYGEHELLQQLEAERAQLEATIQSLPDALYIGNESGISKCNDLAVKMLGFDSGEDLQNNIALIAERIQTRYVDTRERIQPEDEAFSHALRGEPFVRDVIVQQLKTGREIIVRSAASPIFLNGKIIGAVAINTDITEREHLRQRLEQSLKHEREARAEAELALHGRDEFLSVAAHELRTPVTSLRGFVQTLLRRIERKDKMNTEQLSQTLDTINRQSIKLTQLLSHLLDVSRIDTGRLILERQPTDIVKLLKEIVGAMQQTTNQPIILGKMPTSVVASVDPLRLEQVLINLIDNAIKYSDGPVEVELSLPKNQEVQVTVTDHGVGIPPERRAYIFDRYYQAHGVGYLGGMGLGLYISKQIAELHGGRLELASPQPKGTTFILSLPMQSNS